MNDQKLIELNVQVTTRPAVERTQLDRFNSEDDYEPLVQRIKMQHQQKLTQLGSNGEISRKGERFFKERHTFSERKGTSEFSSPFHRAVEQKHP